MSENSPTGDYIQMDAVDWVPFPEGLCDGPIRWKLLHVSPEAGAWTDRTYQRTAAAD